MKQIKLLILFSFAKLFASEIDETNEVIDWNCMVEYEKIIRFPDYKIEPHQLGNYSKEIVSLLNGLDNVAYKSNKDAQNAGWIIKEKPDKTFNRGQIIIYRACDYFLKKQGIESYYWLYGIITGETYTDENNNKYWFIYNGIGHIHLTSDKIGELGNIKKSGSSHEPYYEYPQLASLNEIFRYNYIAFENSNMAEECNWIPCGSKYVPKKGTLIVYRYFGNCSPSYYQYKCWMYGILTGDKPSNNEYCVYANHRIEKVHYQYIRALAYWIYS